MSTSQQEIILSGLTKHPQMVPDTLRIKYHMPAEEACRRLVNAYCNDHQQVDWTDIQNALEEALKAFGLPENYPEMCSERRLRKAS